MIWDLSSSKNVDAHWLILETLRVNINSVYFIYLFFPWNKRYKLIMKSLAFDTISLQCSVSLSMRCGGRNSDEIAGEVSDPNSITQHLKINHASSNTTHNNAHILLNHRILHLYLNFYLPNYKFFSFLVFSLLTKLYLGIDH